MLLPPGGQLVISNASVSDSGLYHCIVRSKTAVDLMPLRLTVKERSLSPTALNGQKIMLEMGNSLSLPCEVTSAQPSQTLWYLPKNQVLLPTQKTRRAEVLENGTLVVRKMTQEDAGEYSCLASNLYGVDITASVSVLAEDDVLLPCKASGNPEPNIAWTKVSTGATIPANTKHGSRFEVFKNGTFLIKNVQLQDRGQYLCTAHNRFGSDRMVITLAVQTEAPRIQPPKTPELSIYLGKTVVDCVATGLPNPEVSWSLPDGTLVNNGLQSDDSGLRNRRYVMYGNGTLLLQQMGRKDEGDYTCHATNKLGKDERKLSVKLGSNAPQIGLKSQSLVKVKLGESVKLSCQATGEPKPRITWISPHTDVIPPLSDKYRVVDDGTLILKKVTLADEGKYACVARNSAGDDIKNMIVEAELQEPYINGVRGKTTAKLLAVSYQTALLDCRVEGKPEPKVWWLTPYGHSLTPPYLGGRFQVHQNGSLELRGVRKTDAGRYKCFAKNHLGEASLSVEMEVASLAEKPSFASPNIEILPIKQDGGELILECPARGTPIPEISWVLPNGTMLSPGRRLQRITHHFGNGTLWINQPTPSDKGIYRCLARNIAGQAEKRYSLEAGWKPVIRGTTGRLSLLKSITCSYHFNLIGNHYSGPYLL
uniref:Ig-like domain-containing protein n=1 Tax=Poecilia mexicana TaxID=48701 RepID=A0A3B3Y547_9TELE